MSYIAVLHYIKMFAIIYVGHGETRKRQDMSLSETNHVSAKLYAARESSPVSLNKKSEATIYFRTKVAGTKRFGDMKKIYQN